MTKPIALIKISRLNNPKDLAGINHKMKEHSLSDDYHVLIAPVLDSLDIIIEVHNDENAKKSKIDEIRKEIVELLNETK